MTTIDEVNQHLDPTICVYLRDLPGDELQLVYTFDTEKDRRAAYYVTIRNWQVVAISAAH